MQCTIMTNGEYAAISRYRSVVDSSEMIICADGGANYAYQMNIVPDCIIGDLDSIHPHVLEHYTRLKVPVMKYPRHKDFTDTQLAISAAEEKGAGNIILLGSLGGRLDHTLSNLYSCLDMALKGHQIIHYHPDYQVYMVNSCLTLKGTAGDVVSVLALTDIAKGVTEIGFEYPLQDAVLESRNPFAVSNVMSGPTAVIRVQEGILAVFHYPQLPGR